MTITLDNLPAEIERALRELAAAEHKSLDETAVEALARGLGIEQPTPLESVEPRDLSGIAGTWESDRETEAILEEQNRIDPEMWK